MPSVAEHPDVPQTPDYVSPYGKLEGLHERLLSWRRQLRAPGSHRPFYGGMAADLEVILRLLNAREFAEWLRQHGDDEQARWAVDILEALDERGELDELLTDIDRVVPVKPDQVYAEAVEQVAKRALQFDLVRAVLENTGALSPGDTETDVPGLIRALLS